MVLEHLRTERSAKFISDIFSIDPDARNLFLTSRALKILSVCLDDIEMLDIHDEIRDRIKEAREELDIDNSFLRSL